MPCYDYSPAAALSDTMFPPASENARPPFLYPTEENRILILSYPLLLFNRVIPKKEIENVWKLQT
jgi:hypothetical protein